MKGFSQVDICAGEAGDATSFYFRCLNTIKRFRNLLRIPTGKGVRRAGFEGLSTEVRNIDLVCRELRDQADE